MNENQNGSNNLLDTTDCLEAVGVFKGWKNLLFVIIVICLLLLQICFWLVNTGWISIPPVTDAVVAEEVPIAFFTVTTEPEQNFVIQEANEVVQVIASEPNLPAVPVLPAESNVPVADEEPAEPEQAADSNEPAAPSSPAESNEPMMMAEEEPAEANESAESMIEAVVPEQPQPSYAQATKDFLFGLTFDHLVWTIRFVNAVLILTATLYCLTMLFSLKVSMLGRLGGINHITRAFFLSLIALVLLLPWHKVFDGVVLGAIFTPEEIVDWFSAKTDDTLDIILYYLRFCGFWLLVLLLLILAQLRSSRWAGAILRRLEII